MPLVNVIHVSLDDANDSGCDARRYIAAQMSKGIPQSDIVKKAWIDRFKPVPAMAASTNPSSFTVSEIYYDPNVAEGAAEQEVIDVIIDASKR